MGLALLSSTGQGAGLGLNISARIIEAMDGTIGQPDTSAAGSRFAVEVKLTVLSPPSQAAA